jgi:hypothetical protein
MKMSEVTNSAANEFKSNLGGIPVDPLAIVEIEFMDGSTEKGFAGGFRWTSTGRESDINKYRVIEG